MSTDWLTAKLLLALANSEILGSEPHGTHDHCVAALGAFRLHHDVEYIGKVAEGSSSGLI
jgi:hypothetical protein